MQQFGPESNYLPNPRYQGSYNENDQFDIICSNQDTLYIYATLENDIAGLDFDSSFIGIGAFTVFPVPISSNQASSSSSSSSSSITTINIIELVLIVLIGVGLIVLAVSYLRQKKRAELIGGGTNNELSHRL